MYKHLQQFGRVFWRHVAAVSAVAVIALSPVAVHADNYGNGAYGSGDYSSSTIPSSGGSSGSSGSSGSGSSSSGSSLSSSSAPASSSNTNESTVVQTDSGLQVAINLSDGQAIPSTGYYITITPINGEGKSFDKAEIYLDDQLAYSGAPDSTGTLKWLWDTSKNPATKVKIIVYGPGSGTTTHEFNVTVSPVDATNSTQQSSRPTTSSSAAPASSGWPQWLLWSLIGLAVLAVVVVVWIIIRHQRNNRQLPPPPFTPMQ